MAVTPIQIMRAYSEMANGGIEVTPHVAQLASGGGTASPSQGPRQIISPSLSSSLTGLMTHVVTAVPSYAQATYIPGYFVGGKTGTAQIWDPTLDMGKGGWMADIYNYSFYGWVGPQLAGSDHRRRDLPGHADHRRARACCDMPVQSTELFRRIATDAVIGAPHPSEPNGPAPPDGKKAKPLG